jgi:uncharacterized protein with HEPN domain
MSKDPIEYIRHIDDECKYILSATNNISSDEFLGNETLKRAVVRSLEVIGEATKKVPDEFRVQWLKIQWKSMAGMRDRLIHDYMGINYTIVWDVVENKIPILNAQVTEILNNNFN